MRLSLIALIGLLLIAFVSGAICQTTEEYAMKDFNEKYKKTVDEEDVNALCRDFLVNATNVDVMRQAQDRWLAMDEEGAREFSKELAEENGESALYAYLYGRTVESPLEQVRLGRQAIELDGEWPYGYRLVLATYIDKFVDGDEGDEDYAILKQMFMQDVELFETLLPLDPKETYPLELLSRYQVYEGKYEDALKTLDKAKALERRWPDGTNYAAIYAYLKQFDDALKAVIDEVDKRIEGGWDAEERDYYIERYYTGALRDARQYQAAIDYNKGKEGSAEDKSALYDIACFYALMNDVEMAVESLEKSVANGWDQVGHTKEDSDLEPLREDARWEGIVAAIQSNWDGGKEDRKKEALASKIDSIQPAPAWTLDGIDGQTISLEDLRGKVVVIDFWATWCGPCRVAMPHIDKFTREYAADDLLVLSINVWEKGKKKPAKFMKENDYLMTLLYGNNDLAKVYDVPGIPTLVIIDKEGNIRYKQVGTSDGLGESLVWWTQDLM